MFGVEDPQVWMAYVLCLASAGFCVVYGMINWNKGDGPVHPEDARWVKEEKIVEDQL